MQTTKQLTPPAAPKYEYKITDMPDGTFKLFLVDAAVYMETEEALVENVQFNSVADLLKFVGLTYPGAKEIYDDV